jgi:predicted DNA-binding transcriptional regulator AlpA
MTDTRKACSVKTFAAEHEVSEASVWRWIKDGHLPVIRLGGRVLVWISDEPPPPYTFTLLDAG